VENANVLDMGHAPSCKAINKEPRYPGVQDKEMFKMPGSLKDTMGWRPFRGEILEYMLRPRHDLEAAMAMVRRLTHGNTVGIHIRHGTDKEWQLGKKSRQNGVPTLSPVADYLDRAMELAQAFGEQPVTFVVATDVTTVVQACREYVQEQQKVNPSGDFARVTIATQEDIVESMDRKNSTNYKEADWKGGFGAFLGVIMDVLLLGNCDYLIGTCTSYVGTMAGQIRLAAELTRPRDLPGHRAVQMDKVEVCTGHSDWHDLDMWAPSVDFSANEASAQDALRKWG
jgi:hypothetical protein